MGSISILGVFAISLTIVGLVLFWFCFYKITTLEFLDNESGPSDEVVATAY